MKLKDLPFKTVLSRLRNGLTIKMGPFNFNIQSADKAIAKELYLLYADFDVISGQHHIDFPVSVELPKSIRRWLYPKVSFSFDGFQPFKPLPKDHSYPLFEWGMNWCIATNAHQYLILHAAVIEKKGATIVMPAPPGSGKSTLTAALVSRGWRLLSDELALISINDNYIYPLARPINLKNKSIEIINNFELQSQFSRPVHDTHKGTVALMKPPRDSVLKMDVAAKPKFVIFPKYTKASPIILDTKPPCETYKELIANSFNYDVLGKQGFNTMSKFVNDTEHFSLEYSSLEEAIDLFNSLVE